MTNTPLLNRKAVKTLALHVAQSSGRTIFTRVGKEFLQRINARVHAMIVGEVHSHPSVGKTLK